MLNGRRARRPSSRRVCKRRTGTRTRIWSLSRRTRTRTWSGRRRSRREDTRTREHEDTRRGGIKRGQARRAAPCPLPATHSRRSGGTRRAPRCDMSAGTQHEGAARGAIVLNERNVLEPRPRSRCRVGRRKGDQVLAIGRCSRCFQNRPVRCHNKAKSKIGLGAVSETENILELVCYCVEFLQTVRPPARSPRPHARPCSWSAHNNPDPSSLWGRMAL